MARHWASGAISARRMVQVRHGLRRLSLPCLRCILLWSNLWCGSADASTCFPLYFSMLTLWLAVRARRECGLSASLAAATLVAFVAVMLSKSSFGRGAGYRPALGGVLAQYSGAGQTTLPAAVASRHIVSGGTLDADLYLLPAITAMIGFHSILGLRRSPDH